MNILLHNILYPYTLAVLFGYDAHEAMYPDFVTLKLDCKNAHNSVTRAQCSGT